MPEPLNPDDVPEVTEEGITVSDVMDAVQSLSLTVDMVLRLLRVFVVGIALVLLRAMLASLLAPPTQR